MLEKGTPVVIVGPEGWDGLDHDYNINGHEYHINFLMRDYIGQKTRTLSEQPFDPWYSVEDNPWWWHESWLKYYDKINIDDNELEEMLL